VIKSKHPILAKLRDSVYFVAKMPTATVWLELLCCQSKA